MRYRYELDLGILFQTCLKREDFLDVETKERYPFCSCLDCSINTFKVNL